MWRVFTARYALSPYIKQIHFVFKRLTAEWSKNSSNAGKEHIKTRVSNKQGQPVGIIVIFTGWDVGVLAGRAVQLSYTVQRSLLPPSSGSWCCAVSRMTDEKGTQDPSKCKLTTS
jgi:hypothetical protein